MTAIVALIGRPNVGKSTLFNRLVGKKLALVDDRPGVTRDRREGDATLGHLRFKVIDTAGLEEADKDSLAGRMRAQTETAIAQADVVVFMIDARLGLTPMDQPFADLVRRSGKPVILLANKAEGKKGADGIIDAYSLGLGDPVPFSAEHGEGTADLLEALAPFVADEPEDEDGDEQAAWDDTAGDDSEDNLDPNRPLRVTIIGRPNAGKSTLVNRMIGEDRLLVGPEAGITRDTISVDWEWRGHKVKLFDTAGMRKRARIEEKLEKLSVADSLRAIRFAEVVVVLLDATIPFEKQDLTLVDLTEREGRAVVIGLNKWDLVADKQGLLAALAPGLVLIERDRAIGGGQLGRYAITSDSTAQTFLSAVVDNPYPEIAALAGHPAARTVDSYRDALGVPLAEVGPLLRATGDRLHRLLTENGGKVLTGHEVIAIRRDGDGLWRARVRDMASGAEHERVARNVVIATGGHQPLDRLVAQRVAGAPLPELARHRLVQSDDMLSTGGFEKVADLIGNVRAPRIAVIGGSTSALATVALLLKKQPALPLGAGAITLLHRRPLRPFYHSVEAAAAENFTDFGPNDICPVSGFVYRLGGFRLEARDLVLRMLGVDGREPDPRVTLHRIGDDEARAREIVAGADLAIAALGYRPRALPVERFDGTPLALAADEGRAMVDRHCRVLDAGGAAVPGLYGIGLAAGFVPWGKLGGEASFVGQANGLWLWQNDVGMMIVDQLLAGRGRRAA